MDRRTQSIPKKILVYLTALVISLGIVFPSVTEESHAASVTLTRTTKGHTNYVTFKVTNVPGYEGINFWGTCADIKKHSVESANSSYYQIGNNTQLAQIVYYYGYQHGWLSHKSGSPSLCERLKWMCQYVCMGQSAFYNANKKQHSKSTADKRQKQVQKDLANMPWQNIPDSFMALRVNPYDSKAQPAVVWYDRGYGRVTINKTTRDTSTLTASGFSLQNTVIRVYGADRRTVRATMVVGAKGGGSQTFYNLIAGEQYWVHEDSIPGNSGYKMDTGWYPVKVGNGGAATVTLYNPAEVSYARVQKVTDPADVTKHGGYSLEGIGFDIYNSAGTKMNTTVLTTDDSGTTPAIMVPAGTGYYAKEVDANTSKTGFSQNTGTSTPITIAEGKTGIIKMTDPAVMGSFTVKKSLSEDSTPGGVLEGFTFTAQNSKSGETYTATTNASGVATFSNIPLGTYKIKETLTETQQKTYASKTKSAKVTLTPAQPNASTAIAWENKHEAYGKVKLYKSMIGDAAGQSPKGFTFRLTHVDNPNYVYYATTDDKGIAYFDKVAIGNYKVTELMTDTQELHYTDVTKKKTITVEYDKTAVLKGPKAWENDGNTPDGFYLVVKKDSLGVDANPEDKFKFNVTLNWDSSTELVPKYSVYSVNDENFREYAKKNINAVNGSSTITLKDGQQMKIGPLPAGTTYSVTEEKHPDYSPAYKVTELEGTVAKESDVGEVNTELTASGTLSEVRGTYKVAYEWTNTAKSNQDINQLEVEKTVSNGSADTFNFATNLSGLTPNEYYAKVTNGENTYTLHYRPQDETDTTQDVLKVVSGTSLTQGVAGVPLTLERSDGKTKVVRTDAEGNVNLADPDLKEWMQKKPGNITVHWLGDDISFDPGLSPEFYEAYAVFDSTDGSLRFFKDVPGKYTNGQTSGTKTYYTGIESLNATSTSGIPWGSKRASIKSVTFEDVISPISTAFWFFGCSNASLTTIDFTNLDTSNVTDMNGMFYGCTSLTSLDVSGFDTANVTNMYFMFASCRNLTSLDLSDFNTSNVTNMGGMFNDCRALTDLDLSSFDTSNVTSMASMFSGCSRLASLDLSSFDTSKVTDMGSMFGSCGALTDLDLSGFDTSRVTKMNNMFSGCGALTSLDLSGFDTSKVTTMSYMFADCSALKTIYVSNSWDVSGVTSSSSMFSNCSSLVGGQGTVYNSSYTDKTRAIIDDGTSNPGYLTNGESEAYAVFDSSDGSLKFFRDRVGKYTNGQVDGTKTYWTGIETLQATSYYQVPWDSKRRNITSVTVEDMISPISTAHWFYMCNNSALTTMDLAKLDTSNVTDMRGMFERCMSLTSLDVSGFDTSKVTNMADMFIECGELTSLDVSDFDTSNVTSMFCMFAYCQNLPAIDVSGFDTSNITNMHAMFGMCSALTSIDLSSFDTSSVTDMEMMFYSCSNLETIYVSNKWDASGVAESFKMFDECTKLVGGEGTTYRSSYTDAARAIIDGGESNPGYLTDIADKPTASTTKKGKTAKASNPIKSLFNKVFKTDTVHAVILSEASVTATGYDITSFQADGNGEATVPFTLAGGENVFFIGMDENSKHSITEFENKYAPSYTVRRTESDGATARIAKGSGETGEDFTTKEVQFPESGKTIDRASFVNAIDTSHLIVTKETNVENDDTDFDYTVNLSNLREESYLAAFPGNATATIETTNMGNIQVTITGSTYFASGDLTGIPVRIIRPDGEARTYYTDSMGQVEESLYIDWLKEGLEEPFTYQIDFLNQMIDGTYGS